MVDEESMNARLQQMQRVLEQEEISVGDVIAEVRQFTTVAGVLFGFLLTVSVAYLDSIPSLMQRALLVLALACTASATLMFILPPLYHHLRFPMDRKQTLQFYWRSHKFIVWGIVPLYVGIYFSILLALSRIIGLYALIFATIVVIVPFVAYELRKIGDPRELG
ncbi:MAG: DUF6328 family protein, partial [Halobacteriota archaeon]